eukprot:3828615-Prymnesium_polylepis.2
MAEDQQVLATGKRHAEEMLRKQQQQQSRVVDLKRQLAALSNAYERRLELKKRTSQMVELAVASSLSPTLLSLKEAERCQQTEIREEGATHEWVAEVSKSCKRASVHFESTENVAFENRPGASGDPPGYHSPGLPIGVPSVLSRLIEADEKNTQIDQRSHTVTIDATPYLLDERDTNVERAQEMFVQETRRLRDQAHAVPPSAMERYPQLQGKDPGLLDLWQQLMHVPEDLEETQGTYDSTLQSALRDFTRCNFCDREWNWTRELADFVAKRTGVEQLDDARDKIRRNIAAVRKVAKLVELQCGVAMEVERDSQRALANASAALQETEASMEVERWRVFECVREKYAVHPDILVVGATAIGESTSLSVGMSASDHSNDLAHVEPVARAVYVVKQLVAGGWAERHGVEVGDHFLPSVARGRGPEMTEGMTMQQLTLELKMRPITLEFKRLATEGASYYSLVCNEPLLGIGTGVLRVRSAISAAPSMVVVQGVPLELH